MKIICENCNSKFNIPDAKLAKGKSIILTCPKCKNKIKVDAKKTKSSQNKEDKELEAEVASNGYNAWDKPFDFVDENKETALICESDQEVKKSISNILKNTKYQTTEAESARDALKKMRFHVYDLIVLDENFDTGNPDNNGVLKYIERLGMVVRRNIFVALLSKRFRTMDNMAAFNKSVNLIINRQNIKDIGQILKASVNENKEFYRVFKESLISTGKI
ncbi:Zinc-ribbon domain-containing protein [Candidatus Magnetomoraceae bacterium gMMP-1]